MKLFGKHKAGVSRESPLREGYVFRRSRTLTGTTSAKVAPSAPARSHLKTERLKVHELHQLRNRIARVLLLVGIGIAVLGYVVSNYTSTLTFQYPQASVGRSAPDTEAYRRAVLSYFVSHPLQRFGAMLDTKGLATELQAKYPELLSVDVDKTWLGNVSAVVLQFRRPILKWEAGGKQFHVDNQGVAFGFDYFGGQYVSVSDRSGIAPSSTSDGAVASNRLITFIGKMVGAVNDSGLGQVTDVIIPVSTREVDIKVKGRGYPIKTQTDRDPLQQAGDIVSALKWFDAKHVAPEYVDVRAPSKAFYK